MRLTALALVLAAACGSGVCAGCGGDDGGDPVPAHFIASTESAVMGCGSVPTTANIEVAAADTDAPTLAPSLIGDVTCSAATDRGDAWVIHCETAVTTDARWSELALAKTMDGGTYTVGGLNCGVGMENITRSTTLLVVEIL